MSIYDLPLTGLPMYAALACNTYCITAAFDCLRDGSLAFTVLAVAICSIEMGYSVIDGCRNRFFGCLASDTSSSHSCKRPASKCQGWQGKLFVHGRLNIIL
jgi:hypothetical protein